MELERIQQSLRSATAIRTELGDPFFSFGQSSLARLIAHGCRSVLVRLGCEFCRTLPNSAEEITLLSLLSMGDNKLWISISGFESLGSSQLFSRTCGNCCSNPLSGSLVCLITQPVDRSLITVLYRFAWAEYREARRRHRQWPAVAWSLGHLLSAGILHHFHESLG